MLVVFLVTLMLNRVVDLVMIFMLIIGQMVETDILFSVFTEVFVQFSVHLNQFLPEFIELCLGFLMSTLGMMLELFSLEVIVLSWIDVTCLLVSLILFLVSLESDFVLILAYSPLMVLSVVIVVHL